MSEARQRERWEHTSAIIAFNINCHLGPKQKPHSPARYNPFKKQTRQMQIPKKDQFALLKALFVGADKKK